MADISKPALLPHPSRLFVETTTRCNLGCAMCVKHSAAHGMTEGTMSAATFRSLAPAFPRLQALVLNGVGEPLLHPQLEEFIRLARSTMPADGWIGFQTNGLLLHRDRAVALLRAGLDRICISVDSLNPETFTRIRQGGEVADIDGAFAALAAARSRHPASPLEVGVEFVVLRENIRELPEVIRWAARRGASFALVTHLVPYGEEHAGETAYDAVTDAALAIFRQWRETAEREGVDLTRYRGAPWRFARSADEQLAVDLVARMKGEALSQGIFLDVDKLLRRDEGRFAEAEEIFARAREIAAQEGLRLELPELVPRQERRCDFVEEGGAFVSWQGEIHPCYFLWHRYRCHVQGWRQTVTPKVFGSARDGILEVWNGEDFRRFRESVVAYDHPHCFSCSFAPCDYVGSDTFEQDCHIRQEPCGACLWCMGVFRCLQ